ncbi:putative ribonuclease H-like domain-containing protein [Tanacetum coccineum]
MDVKSVFLYGKIEEKVYVCQPLGFEDPNFPDRVYKVEKALYGLHQAPRAIDASKQGSINAINADEEITLVSVQDDADKEMFDVDALNYEEVFVAWQNENVVEEVVDAAQVSTAATTVTITTEEITLAQALEALKTSKPKVKGIVFQEPAKFDEEERLAREKAKKEQEANISLIETWDDIQVKIDADHQLAERLQAQEQEELSVEEKATLF